MKYFLLIMLAFFLLMYHFSEGAIQGYTWADGDRQMENCLIRGGEEGAGIMDYHTYRMFENIGIAGSVIIALLFPLFFTMYQIFLPVKIALFVGTGAYLSGFFIYERVLMFVNQGVFFKEPGWCFYIFGTCIPRYPWQDWILLITGIVLMVWGVLLTVKRS